MNIHTQVTAQDRRARHSRARARAHTHTHIPQMSQAEGPHLATHKALRKGSVCMFAAGREANREEVARHALPRLAHRTHQGPHTIEAVAKSILWTSSKPTFLPASSASFQVRISYRPVLRTRGMRQGNSA